MCMIDGSERVTPIGEGRYIVARKEHKCAECWRKILIGERYHTEAFVSDGEFATHKTCAHCMVARDWLMAECGGWVFDFVQEDVAEHWDEGDHDIRLARLIVGMRRKWTTRRGDVMRLPQMPAVTP